MQQKRVQQLKELAVQRGLPLMDNPSHIVPILVGDPVKCRELTDGLLKNHGIYLQPINYPTVAKGTERVRITPGPLHNDEDLLALVDALEFEWKRLGLNFVRTQTSRKVFANAENTNVCPHQLRATAA